MNDELIRNKQKRNINYEKLWIRLITEKIENKTELMKLCGFNSNVLSALSKNEPVHLKYLLRICELLHCNIQDIVTFDVDIHVIRKTK